MAKIVVYEAAAASGADAAVDDLRTVADSTGEWRCLCICIPLVVDFVCCGVLWIERKLDRQGARGFGSIGDTS